ncbi:MAG: hypothetical protein GX135_01890 [Candidatus Cloacimonetes bacterium]|jgi:hypothetical protein|nr:hypothetical protein [Candidatus Cloacimonadota bacterium]
MKKKNFAPGILLFVLLILPAAFSAQSLNDEYIFPGDEAWDDPIYEVFSRPNYGLGGLFGNIMVGGNWYSQVRLRPEMSIWKVGIGMDIDLLFDGEGRLRRTGWENWEDLAKKLFYLRFADRRDSLYFKVGCIPDYTLGHGLIFDDYSNMLRYPEEKPIGAYLGANTNAYGFGFELYTHDISKNEIIAGKAGFKPLLGTRLPILKNISIGGSFGADRNPCGKYPDSDGDGIPDIYDKFPHDPRFWLDTDDDGIPDELDIDLNGNSIIDHPDLNPYVNEIFPNILENYPDYPFDTAVFPDSAAFYPKNQPMWIYSLNYELPLVDTEGLRLSNYGEYAIMRDHGNGIILPGLAARFLIFDMKVEFRHFNESFLPAYFNYLYDEQRCQVVDTVIDGRRHYSLRLKQDELADLTSSLGWFGYLKANIANFAYMKVAYQNMFGDDVVKGKSLWAKLSFMPEKFPRLKEASIYYAQTDVNKMDLRNWRNPNSQINGRIVYSYSDNYNLVCRYREYYRDVNGDGEIKGKDEIIESLSLGIEFQF